MARCRYILDDLSNNINKLQLKIKKFGKTTGSNMELDLLGVHANKNNQIIVSPRRSLRGGPQVPLLVETNQRGSFNQKSPTLKSKKKKEAKEVQIKYPYDDRLPSMISTSIDDFI